MIRGGSPIGEEEAAAARVRLKNTSYVDQLRTILSDPEQVAEMSVDELLLASAWLGALEADEKKVGGGR